MKFRFHTPLLVLSIITVTLAASCKKKTACDTVSCNGGGSCNNGVCQCDWLHEGEFCEIEKRAKYFGSFVGKESCTSRNHLDYIRISALEGHNDKLNFHNLYGNESDDTGIIQTDGTVHIYPQQWYSDSISGTAYITDGKIVVNYIVTDGSTADTCTWTQLW